MSQGRAETDQRAEGEGDQRAEIERLRAQIAERDEFIAFVAHELRNPMHALSLQLASARALASVGRARDVIERVGKAQATLSRYIDRATVLLDMARRNTLVYPVAPRSVDLATLLARVIDSARQEAEFHGVKLILEAAAPCTAEIDPLALEHVVGNLLVNAFKHAQCSQVLVSLKRSGAGAEIAIEDDGRGIAEADRQQVFEKFGRGSTEPLKSGSGLGLWIARELMHALGGTLVLNGRQPSGCLFLIAIPIAAEPEAPS